MPLWKLLLPGQPGTQDLCVCSKRCHKEDLWSEMSNQINTRSNHKNWELINPLKNVAKFTYLGMIVKGKNYIKQEINSTQNMRNTLLPLWIQTAVQSTHLLECLLINCNLCWKRCFSVTCWISIKPFTISNTVSFRRAFAKPESSSHGTRCWYFLRQKIRILDMISN